MKKIIPILTMAALFLIASCGPPTPSGRAHNTSARTRMSIVGSSTVFPFASTVAEQLAGASGGQTAKIEANGTGGGIAIFCRGVGLSHPDIANASRKMKKSEFEECGKNGIDQIIEIKIGYDGIVLANAKSGAAYNLTPTQIYLALAKTIPVNGKLVANPNQNWSDIDPSLPNNKIDVMGPPPTSGTRDAFVEMILEKGAAEIPFMKALKESNEEEFKSAAGAIREDGAWKDMGENDNLIVQALVRSPAQLGVFGYSFLEENHDKIKPATIGGIEATFENISSGKYKASRSLYIYVKKAHLALIKDIASFMSEFVSDKASGEHGYLLSRGMIPLHQDERLAQQAIVQNQTIMAAPE